MKVCICCEVINNSVNNQNVQQENACYTHTMNVKQPLKTMFMQSSYNMKKYL